MATQNDDLKQSAERPALIDAPNSSVDQPLGFRARLSSATKAAGSYITSAGEGISQASREVRDMASSSSSKTSTLASDAYQGAVDTKDSLKGKAMDAGKVALAGAGVAVASSLAIKGLKAAAKTKGLEVLKPLGKGNVAANLVDATITVGHEGYKLYRGETTKSEMAHACAEKGTGMLASVGGAGIGAMAAVALSLPTGGASLVVGGASMLAGYAAPRAYKAGRKLVGDLVDKRALAPKELPVTEGNVEINKDEKNNLKD